MKSEPHQWPGEARDVAMSRQTIDVGAEGSPIPLTCRWPKGGMPKAFVVFCHGLGAGGQDYEALSCFLASHGYLVIHPTFPDWIGAVAAAEPALGYQPDAPELLRWTTVPALRKRLYEILHTPFYWMERIRIVREVMGNLDKIIASTCGAPRQPIPGAIAGHSFGAYTSQLFAGAEIDIPGKGVCQFKDDRFGAAVLLSAQGRDQQGLRDGSWNGMTGPVLTVTGTRDEGSKGQDWLWKIEPFELAPPGGKFLAVIEDADHYLGGMTDNDPSPHIPAQRDAASMLTLGFLDAHVARDETATGWLASIEDRIGSCRALIRRK